MSVIEFPGGTPPGGKPPPRKKPPGKRVVQPDTPHNKLILGPINYTCPNCATKAILTGEYIIFRQLDYYCSVCGTLHRMVNPAFTTGVRK
jgi:rubredoxin